MSFLTLGKFGQATKFSILSNDQLYQLFAVGSILYTTSCSHETTDFNLGCAAMRSNTVKTISQKTFEMLKFLLSYFNFLNWYELQDIKYVQSPVVVAYQ